MTHVLLRGSLITGLLLFTTTSVEAQRGLTYSGPLVITKGGTYRGNWQSLDPRRAAVTVNTSQPVVIEFSNIQSRGPLILSHAARANLTVRNTRGVALNPGRPLKEYRYPGRFLLMEEFESVTVENNELVGTSGMYFRKWIGSAKKGQTIKVLRNRARNIDGRYSIGKDRFSPSQFRLVQFVQFNDVKNITGAEIAWNEVVNEPGKSRPEENINMFLSSGVASSRIKIHDNYIQGAYAANPVTDEYAGGGMNLGDGGSRTLAGASGYILAYRNQVVNTSNQGIVVSAGHHIEAFENRIVSSGYTPSAKPVHAQNVGMYIWDAYKNKQYGTFRGNVFRNNEVGWARPLLGKDVQNPFWFPDCEVDEYGESLCTGNETIPGPITQTLERAELGRWQAKLTAADVVVGPQPKANASASAR
ncbi:hypothetical protein [Deinococcus pimensis]|uniref:hypothetical protein n=1 Tax=Deinococcus pimensis TaxID=309888 RepID=UPI0004847CCD|nr:hypothetical protein [Deinococcus pimensis]